MNQSLYAAYSQASLLEASPMRLVIALYEGAVDAIDQAMDSLASGDPWARSRSISKAVTILTELMYSLDHEKGGEVSANLKRLYSYMQQRLLLAHAQQTREPMTEVKGLLLDLLEGWRKCPEFPSSSSSQQPEVIEAELVCEPEPQETNSYGGYFSDSGAPSAGAGYSF